MTRFTAFIALLIVLVIASHGWADGKAFTGVDRSAMFVGRSDSQYAWISCDGKTQRMIIAINLNLRDKETAGLWLVPVRGRATEASIGRLRDVPRLRGRDPRRDLGDKLSAFGGAIVLTQVWPAPIAVCAGGLFLPSLSRARDGVVRADAIEQDGLRTELLDAASIESLAAHLKSSGATLPDGGLDSFKPYFDGKHCFVATWITDATQLAKSGRQPAMFVAFPSAELWYPMRATSGYGDEFVDVTVIVDGLVEADDASARRGVDARHYRALRDADRASIVQQWLGRDAAAVDYTVIDASGIAKTFASDITFRSVRLEGWSRAALMVDWLNGSRWTPWVVGMPLAAMALALCGAVAGAATRTGVGFGALVGLSGLLTLAATWFLTRDAKGSAFDRLRQRRADYLIIYSACVTLTGVIVWIIGQNIAQ